MNTVKASMGSVRFIRASVLLRKLHASHADQSWEITLKKLTTPDLLIIDDFSLSILSMSQAENLYELVAERHLKTSFILTSNRKVEAWADLFPAPAMGNAVVDRLSNHSDHVILEGDSCRRHMRPKLPTSPKKET